jgi:hypothetical protein
MALMDTVLVVFSLTIKSSYSRNIEAEATDDEFDTVQFFFGGGDAWRIKTYAMDHDVHVWNIGRVEDLVELARTNTQTHYGDVLAEAYILKSDAGVDGIRTELANRGLDVHLEVSSSGFVFWVPAGTSYGSKSRPEDSAR